LQNLKIFARVHALPRRLAEARSIETLEAVGFAIARMIRSGRYRVE
jgi:hypothetical protein